MNIPNNHSFFTTYHEGLGLSVFNCGFQKCEPGFSWGPALRNHHIIHFIASGKGVYEKNGVKYTLGANDGFYCPADEMVFYIADSEQPWEYYWVGFNGVDSPWLLSAAGLSSENPCFKCDNSEPIVKSMLDIYNSNGHNIYNEVEMIGSFYRLMSYIIRENQSTDSIHRKSTDYINLSIKFIEHNYSRLISVNDIAASAGISRSHLYRLFTQELNITPNEYLIQYRLNNACKLLRDSNINISEAAYSSGFSDPLYFSRVFKRVKGMTPTEYASAEKKRK